MRHIYHACACISVSVLSSCGNFLSTGSRTIGFVVSAGDIETKGTVITKETLESDNFGQFKFDAYLDQKGHDSDMNEISQDYITDGVATYQDNEWQITSGTYYWINDVATRFWCYAPVSINGTRTINPSNKTLYGVQNLDFSYELPASGQKDSEGKKIDATKQDDLVFAYAIKTWKEGSHTSHDYDKVNVTFYHALAEINFIIDLTDGSFGADLEVKDITLENVATGGTCVFSGAYDSFTWTPSTTKDSYSQSYTKAQLGYRESTDPDYDEGTNSISAIRKAEMPFMMIPQDLSTSDAKIMVTFSFKPVGSDETITREREATIDDTWLAGRYYTYRLKATSISTPYDFSFSVDLWQDGGSEFITPEVN